MRAYFLSFGLFLAIFEISVAWQSYEDSRPFVDFSYTQYLMESGTWKPSGDQLVISTSGEERQSFEFPKACRLKSQLTSVKSLDPRSGGDLGSQSSLNILKQKMTDLLKLSDKIKKTKATIGQFGSLSSVSMTLNVQLPSLLIELNQDEEKLRNISKYIDQRTYELQDIVRSAIKGSENYRFAEANLKFEQEYLTSWVSYLEKLRDNTVPFSEHFHDTFVTQYYQKIDESFSGQTDIIDSVESFLNNNGQITQHRKTKKNLQAQIAALKLQIASQEQCNIERINIGKRQQDSQTHNLIRKLKELKKEEIKSSSYCEGVAAKLIERIKKLLIMYNYSFACSQGLEESKRKLREALSALREVEAAIAAIEGGKGVQGFRLLFGKMRQSTKNKILQLKQLSLSDFQHNPNKISFSITEAKSRLKKIETELSNLGPSQPLSVDYNRIKALVKDIKVFKAKYCEQKQKYEQKARNAWQNYRVHEQKVQSNIYMYNRYMETLNNLKSLQISFDSKRRQVLSLLGEK